MFSSADYPNGSDPDGFPTDKAEPDGLDLITQCLVGTCLCLIILMSIVGNLLVCISIYTDRRLRKLGNLFLVSLAVADLLVASLVMTFAVPNDLLGYWMFGRQFCDTWIAFDVMCCTASILNLCAISLDRFLHIKDPLRYGRWMTKRTVLTTIAAIWLLSALVSFLPIGLGWHGPQRSEITSEDVNHPVCALDLTPVYATVSSTISFFVPCVVMIALYSRLYVLARKHVKEIRAMTKCMPQQHADGAAGRKTSGSHHATDHKAAITLGIIMGVFVVSWFPFFLCNILYAFCKTCLSPVIFQTLTWLGYFNSTLNPIIYSIFNSEFRDAFRKILTNYWKGQCCDRFQCSDLWSCRDRGSPGKTITRKLSKSCSPMPDGASMMEVRCEHSGAPSEV